DAHRKRYHEVDRQVYRCPKCTFATFSQSSFDKHMKKLHGPDSKLNSVCDICGKGFVTRNQLKMHREIHSADKKYKCRECPFATNTLSGLRSHSYAQH
uniref:C2H2-type domain-containing protein n=1 Tax=Capitella teleta TaxID=283909 RepID=X2B2F0_CAPTE